MTTTRAEIAKESCEDSDYSRKNQRRKECAVERREFPNIHNSNNVKEKKENVAIIVDKRGYMHHCRRFRLRASSGSSSSSRSAVSAGLRSECTLEAILDRLVGGPGVSMPLKGYRAPGSVQPLSALRVDGTGSFDPGGVPCLDGTCRGPRGSW